MFGDSRCECNLFLCCEAVHIIPEARNAVDFLSRLTQGRPPPLVPRDGLLERSAIIIHCQVLRLDRSQHEVQDSSACMAEVSRLCTLACCKIITPNFRCAPDV